MSSSSHGGFKAASCPLAKVEPDGFDSDVDCDVSEAQTTDVKYADDVSAAGADAVTTQSSNGATTSARAATANVACTKNVVQTELASVKGEEFAAGKNNLNDGKMAPTVPSQSHSSYATIAAAPIVVTVAGPTTSAVALAPTSAIAASLSSTASNVTSSALTSSLVSATLSSSLSAQLSPANEIGGVGGVGGSDDAQIELDCISIDDVSISSVSGGNNHRQNSTTSRSSNCSYVSSSAVLLPSQLSEALTTTPSTTTTATTTTTVTTTTPTTVTTGTSLKSLTFARDIPNTMDLALHYSVVPPSPSSLSCVINLNVGGYTFSTSLSTLVKYEDSMLAVMFSGRHAFSKDREGRYFIDRDGQYFGHILSYLRSDALPPEDVVLFVLREAEFFCLQSLIEKLEASSPRVIAIRRREYFRALIPDYDSIKKSIVGVASQKRTAFEESIVVLTQDNHAKLQGSIPCYNCTREPVCVTHDCTFQGNKSDITIKVKTQEINMDKMIGFIVNELGHDGFAVQSNVVVCKFSLRCHSCTMSGLYTAGGILAPRECPNMAHVLTFNW